jgi:hypothetical protein
VRLLEATHVAVKMLLVALLGLLSFSTLSFALAETVTVYAQQIPLLSNPSPVFKLSYDRSTNNATLASYNAPVGSRDPADTVKLGLYDPKTKHWQGSVITSAASFDDRVQKRLKVFVDEKGDVFHVAFVAAERGVKESLEKKKKKTKSYKEQKEIERQQRKEKKARKKGVSFPDHELEDEVVIEVNMRTPGPKPALNKPVVLGADGKVGEKEPEKSFFQK